MKNKIEKQVFSPRPTKIRTRKRLEKQIQKMIQNSKKMTQNSDKKINK